MAAQGEGIRQCEAALQRLIDGKPVVPEHVGLPRSKITAGIVSVEAGFDRGYLKKTRKRHMPIVAIIVAFRSEPATTESSTQEAFRRARNAAEKAQKEAQVAKDQLAAVVTQNLQLLSQLRELEKRCKTLPT